MEEIMVTNTELLNIHYFFMIGFAITLLLTYIRVPRKNKFKKDSAFRFALYEAKRDKTSWKALDKYAWGFAAPFIYIFKIAFDLDKTFDAPQLLIIIVEIVFVIVICNIVKYRIIYYRLSKL